MINSKNIRIMRSFFDGIHNKKLYVKTMKEKIDTYNAYNKQMKRWLMLFQEGLSICGYLESKGYKKIAIYGMGDIGQLLNRECEMHNIDIMYNIDMHANCKNSKVPIYYLGPGLKEVDCIILTVYTRDNILKKRIQDVTGYNVITFEEILDDITKRIFL